MVDKVTERPLQPVVPNANQKVLRLQQGFKFMLANACCD